MVLGIRCWHDKFAFVVAKGPSTNPEIIESDVRKFPADLERAGFLNWISKEIKGVLHRHPIAAAGFKALEGTAFRTVEVVKRAEVEGVIQAVLYESGCKDVDGLTKQQIKAAIGYNGKAAEVVNALEGTAFAEMQANIQDAALVAWALLK